MLRTRLTGSSNLIDKNNENLTLNMIQGMAIDVAMVTLIVLLLFKSVRMTLVVLVPNLLPILVVAGVMGLAGVSMKVSTSIIFTIAFGIAVDDTIHFISKLRLTMGHEPDLFKAVRRTYISGRAGGYRHLAHPGGRLRVRCCFHLLMARFTWAFSLGSRCCLGWWRN
ncbi:MAG: MMPL family transporter [Hymenobacter sp.]